MVVEDQDYAQASLAESGALCRRRRALLVVLQSVLAVCVWVKSVKVGPPL